jgi:hypothetical protein
LDFIEHAQHAARIVRRAASIGIVEAEHQHFSLVKAVEKSNTRRAAFPRG